jgi:hypothetical protein
MSKLNPQKATAYVGPGVLRKGGKITPVPNGPLVKKKGQFKGSTLKAGGKIKKAQAGVKTADSTGYYANKAKVLELKGATSNNPSQISRYFNASDKAKKDQDRQKLKGKPGYDANGFPKKKAGGMIKRADGSYSKRGLWDNIRANKGSGKKPTKQMLQQEKKIKATAKDGKWIQKAVNPAHKGYCTPMTKATCTPKRKALAKTFKAMAKKNKK